MGDLRTKLRVGVVGLIAACLGTGLAVAVASAQGPPDYQPPTSTVPAPSAKFVFKAGDKAQVLDGFINVRVRCNQDCLVSARGRLRVTNIPGERDNPGQRGAGKGPNRSKSSKSFSLADDTLTIPASGEETLRLGVSGDAERAVQRAHGGEGEVHAKLEIAATNKAGDTARDTMKIKLREQD